MFKNVFVKKLCLCLIVLFFCFVLFKVLRFFTLFFFSFPLSVFFTDPLRFARPPNLEGTLFFSIPPLS